MMLPQFRQVRCSMQWVRLRRWACAFAVLSLALTMGAPMAAATGPEQTGPSGLRLPRFVSLKSDKVNVRQGPSRDHQVVWQFTRAALPVEITAEYENWRRIRDADGSEGWVQQALLSGRRTALVLPWAKDKTTELRARGSDTSDVRAKLESGVLVSLKSCNRVWCRVSVNDVDGYVRQDTLWGVYPDETFE